MVHAVSGICLLPAGERLFECAVDSTPRPQCAAPPHVLTIDIHKKLVFSLRLPHATSQVTVLTASLMLAGYGVFVFSVFAADLQHIISKGLTKCDSCSTRRPGWTRRLPCLSARPGLHWQRWFVNPDSRGTLRESPATSRPRPWRRPGRADPWTAAMSPRTTRSEDSCRRRRMWTTCRCCSAGRHRLHYRPVAAAQARLSARHPAWAAAATSASS